MSNKQFSYLLICKNTAFKGLFYLFWTKTLGNNHFEGDFKQENFISAEEIGQLQGGN